MSSLIFSDKEIFFNKEDFESKRELSADTGICLDCEKIVKIKQKQFDLTISNKLKVIGVDAKCCVDCGSVIKYKDNSIFKIKETIENFKRSRPSISELLSSTDESSYRWCESMMCACSGASNCSGNLSDYLYDKEDWIQWKTNNPKNESNLYKIILNHDIRMELILAIKEILYLPPKEAASCVGKNNAIFMVGYEHLDSEDITYDLEKIKNHFKTKNIDINIIPNNYDKKYRLFIRTI